METESQSTEVVTDPAQTTTDPSQTTATEQPVTPVRPEWIPEKFWDGTTNEPKLEALAKSYSALETKLSAKAPVVPEGPDKYSLKPQDWPADATWNTDAEKTLADVYHKAGLTQEQAAAVTAHFIELERNATADGNSTVEKMVADKFAEAERQRINEHNDAVTAGLKDLAKDWGPDYDNRMALITGLARQAGVDPADPELFGSIKVVRMLGRVTSMLGEAAQKTIASTKVVNGFGSGPDEARAIMRDPTHPDHAKWAAGDKATAAKVNQLLMQG